MNIEEQAFKKKVAEIEKLETKGDKNELERMRLEAEVSFDGQTLRVLEKALGHLEGGGGGEYVNEIIPGAPGSQAGSTSS